MKNTLHPNGVLIVFNLGRVSLDKPLWGIYYSTVLRVISTAI